LPQHPRLDTLAQRIEPTATWDDLALAPRDLANLREIAGSIRQRRTVGPTPEGPGTGILFSGGSPAVKTQAAEALARDLNLDLFRVDLSAVISKYIGETEKNLGRLFDAAEVGGAVLLFDEADALLGKRSEVKDSHDRYAQIELAYLLQRIEASAGIAILAIKPATRPSPAVLRRLKVVRFQEDAGHMSEA
jgi:SpoVK/Ycf46/Vps4 family AAA+-type ATPase